MGVTGGALPDYADLRSGMKRHLKHRGFSHGYLMLAASTAFVFVVLGALNREVTGLLFVPEPYVRAWSAAFAFGFASHLVGDACTRGGIQPALPFSRRRIWLLPRVFRGKSVGWQNGIAQVAAVIVLGISLAGFITLQR
jgi:membrane-bound metal-dependent hydrolase YbcI (DUF457 family)